MESLRTWRGFPFDGISSSWCFMFRMEILVLSRAPVDDQFHSGRNYRGRKCNGYGVYDFRIPKNGSPSKLVGYGTQPGIE
jgi:hypothetical protein